MRVTVQLHSGSVFWCKLEKDEIETLCFSYMIGGRQRYKVVLFTNVKIAQREAPACEAPGICWKPVDAVMLLGVTDKDKIRKAFAQGYTEVRL